MADNLPVPSGSDGQLVVTVDSRQAIAGLSAIEAKFIQMTNTVNNGVSQMAPAFNRFQNFIKNAIAGISSYFVLKDVFRILKAGFDSLVNAASAFVSRMIEVNRVYTGFIASMSIIRGSTKAAADEYEFLLAMSNKLGVSVESSITQYHRLAAALKNVDTTGELTRHIFSGISQAAVVLHSRGRDVTLIFEAVQQMASKGKLSLEELQRQLGNTLPGAVSTAARAMMQSQSFINAGVKTASEAEQLLRRQIKDGTLNVYEFLLFLSNQLKKDYGEGVKYASDQFTANFERMNNAVFAFYRIVGSSGAMSGLTKIVEEITALFNDGAAEGAYGLGKALGQVFEDMAKWISQLDANDVEEFFAAVQGSVEATFIVVSSFFELWSVFDSSETKTPLFNFVRFVGESMAGLIDLVKAAVTGIRMLFGSLINMWISVKNIFTGGEFGETLINGVDRMGRAMGVNLPGRGARDWYRGVRAGIRSDRYQNDVQIAQLVGQAEDAFSSTNSTYARTQTRFNALQPTWHAPMRAGSTGMDVSGYMRELKDRELRDVLDRILANSGAPNSGNGKSGSDAEAKTAEQARNQLIRDYERMEDRVGRWRGEVGITEKAEDKLRRAEEDLTEAVGKRDPVTGQVLLTEAQHQEIMKKLRERYEEALDPIGFVMRAYDKEAISLQYVGDAAQEYSEILKQQEKWRQNNVEYTDQDIEQLREKIRLQNELNRMQSAINGVLNDTKYRQRDELYTIYATGNLLEGHKNPDGSTERITKGQASMKVMDIFGQDNLAGSQEYYEAQYQIYSDFLKRVKAARKEGIISEQTAHGLELQAWNRLQNSKLDVLSGYLGQAAGLMNTNSKKAFKIGQAAAIAQATIDTYKGATGAWASAQVMPYPLNLIAGAAGVAISIATGMAQISKIRSQQMPSYATGGEYLVGGTGGVDSQLVQFHATPGERISINTPSQASAMQDTAKMLKNNQNRGNVTQNLTIIQQGKPNNQTSRQEARQVFKAGRKLVKV